MVAAILESSAEEPAPLSWTAPLPDGAEPERRMVLCGSSWDRYLEVDKQLGDDRSGARLFYFHGEIEVVTTSNEHERIKKWIDVFLSDYFFEAGIAIDPRGQATLRDRLKEAGAEPDESWCVGGPKERPDIVLEIALSSGGIDKLKIYGALEIPEVWIWRKGRMQIFVLSEGQYEPAERSAMLPGLDLGLVEKCVEIRDWTQARRTFRAGLARP